MLSEAHTYSNAVFQSDFTDRHVLRERRGANCSALNTSILRCTYFLEFTHSTSLSSCSGEIQRKFVSPKYTYTVHPQTMQLLEEHLIDKTCPSVISTPHTPVPNVDRDCKMFTPRLREPRHTRGASRYTLQSITSGRGDNIIYIIHARLEGIASLEIEAISSAGNVGTLYPGSFFVAPSNDVGAGQSDRCIQNGKILGRCI